MVEILDTTLREGEQTPYVNFTVDEKVEIARMLDQVGVDMIEAGDPSVSPNVTRAVEKIAGLDLQAEIVAHSIASREGIDRAKTCGADRVAIFYATSQIHLDVKLHKTPDEAVAIICEHVDYARRLDLKVRYTPEDATRTDFEFLVRVCNEAIEAGADRISFADTLGIMQPHVFYERVCNLRERLLPCKIDVHCHNDYGLALANAMAGFRAGADCVHTTVNGMGERTGIPDLAETIVAFHNLEGVTKFEIQPLMNISGYLEKVSGFFLAPNKPITGQNAFSHKSGVHTNGILKDPRTYEPFDPGLLGRERKIVIDKYTGRSAVAARLDEYGIEVSASELDVIVSRIKNLGDQRSGVPLPEETLQKIRSTDAALFGAVTTPPGIPDYSSPVVRMRQVLDLYANLRPCRSIRHASSRPGIDMVIVRENTEGLYSGIERLEDEGRRAVTERVITRRGSERIIRKAFEVAGLSGRKTVHVVHKANVLRQTCGLFRAVALEVARDYPDVALLEMLVDTCAMELVRAPEQFEVIVTTNLFGDILSDEACMFVGGLGVAASGNIGADAAVFEPVHGGAPDLFGTGRANPIATILASAMMLDYLGEAQHANCLREVVDACIASGHSTPDLGGKLTTSQATAAVIAALETNLERK